MHITDDQYDEMYDRLMDEFVKSIHAITLDFLYDNSIGETPEERAGELIETLTTIMYMLEMENILDDINAKLLKSLKKEADINE